jgi:hypothetical protein
MEALAVETSECTLLASSYILIAISDYCIANNQTRWNCSARLTREKDVNYG